MRKNLFLPILLLIAAPTAPAQTFVVMSFNTLHYGWGANTAHKDQAIYDVARAASADAIVLQEIMPQANFAYLETLFPPAAADFVVSQNSYGTNRYQERYVTILARSKFAFLQRLEFPALAAPGGPFSRPPMLLKVQPDQSASHYYIGGFHAIWGRHQSQRTAEAAAICTALLPLVGSTNIALGGDWNLTAAQVTANGTCMNAAQPTGLTTLNRDGTQYSSSYDHAVTFTGGTLVIDAGAVHAPPDTKSWRRNVSDHVPVYVRYRYQ